MKTVRIGLLGFGRVGAAVARAAGVAQARFRARGLDLVVTCALVGDARRPRDLDADAPPLTDAVEVFFSRAYDVVVEVVGGVEPARALVARALDRGVPVVTANKSLVAAHGAALRALAARRGTSLRYEASAIAGVPFIDTLARRPLVADVSRLSGIVNGTSHYVLTAMERERLSFAEALDRARQLGTPSRTRRPTSAAATPPRSLRSSARTSAPPGSRRRRSRRPASSRSSPATSPPRAGSAGS